jgi:hypothetical protein
VNDSNDKHKKTVTIVVDGTEYEVEKGKLTYAAVVTLAFPEYPRNPQVSYSVTYLRGRHEGILAPGGEVQVVEGMEFRVSPTGQS